MLISNPRKPLLFLALCFVVGCSSFRAKRWIYQLQNYSGFAVKHAKFKETIFVIDALRDGKEWSAEAMGILKNSGRNRVLSYLSVGEAEEGRWYYGSLPKDLVLSRNPVFKDNYPVKFWEDRWKTVMEESLSRILRSGFDGVYLDRVDIYSEVSRPLGNEEMGKWVVELSRFAKERNPKFLVFIQNAPCLARGLPSSTKEEFWESVDGLGLESTFFYGSSWEDNPLSPQKEVLDCIEEFVRRGKILVGVEYVRDSGKQVKALQLLRNNSIVGLVTDRGLKGEFMGLHVENP